MLAAMLGRWPVEIEDRGIVPDELEAVTSALERAAAADIIVTTGGASVGDHDLVRPALERAGAKLDFWRVAMKPGKPLMAGRLGGAILLGLPGNPVSAFVTARLFLLPLVARMLGAAEAIPPSMIATLETGLPPTGRRAEYVRAVGTPTGVRPLADQDSAALLALASADVLIVRPPDSRAAAAGDNVDILLIA
jgi:molybdopterin molybdotransferase